MENLSLSPATQAVLTALADLGQGNVHELADKSGKARSTTDKALRTLADAHLIVAVDTGADPAEGTPTRWALSETTRAALEAANLSDEPAGAGEADADADEGSIEESDVADPDSGVAADGPDTGDIEQTGQSHDGDPGNDTEAHDTDTTHRDGETSEAAEDNSSGDGPDGTEVQDADGPVENQPAAVQPPRPGDRKVMAIKGVLADHSGAGATLDVIVAESGISHPTTIRLLAAMVQADAARRAPGLPERWIAGPTKASEVDPNPEPARCPLCRQVIRGAASTPSTTTAVLPLIRADGTLHIVGPDDNTYVVTLPTRTPARTPGNPGTVTSRGDGSVNADGNQPFARGELERLTISLLAANPGRPMTPQEIATGISTQLGRTVSSGAVRNNCTKAAAAGSILLVSDAPLTFASPAATPADNDGKDDGPADDTEQNPDSPERTDHTQVGGETEQS